MIRPWKRQITTIAEHKESLKIEETHGTSTQLRDATLDDLRNAARAEGYELRAIVPELKHPDVLSDALRLSAREKYQIGPE